MLDSDPQDNECQLYSDKEINDFQEITFEETLMDHYKSYKRGAHGMVFAKTSNIVFDKYQSRAAVMMQMRFDGTIGFAGGLIDDSDENVVAGLNREFIEEINMKTSKVQFDQTDHIVTFIHHITKFILHFYLKEIPLDLFLEIEKNVIYAKDYGIETLGIMRVPCYVWSDGKRGLPKFLRNQFIGKAKQQLVLGLVEAGIFTRSEMDHIMVLSNNAN